MVNGTIQLVHGLPKGMWGDSLLIFVQPLMVPDWSPEVLTTPPCKAHRQLPCGSLLVPLDLRTAAGSELTDPEVPWSTMSNTVLQL